MSVAAGQQWAEAQSPAAVNDNARRIMAVVKWGWSSQREARARKAYAKRKRKSR